MSTPAEKSLAMAASTSAEKSPPEAKASGADDIPAAEQAFSPSPPRQKWYQWFAPDDTLEERRLIIKLDCLIMIFVFLAYWAKVLDSSATSTAYVSGMKEDLKLYGNELNYLNTTYMYESRHRLEMSRLTIIIGSVL